VRTRWRRLVASLMFGAGEQAFRALRPPINLVLVALLRRRVWPNSVLHISYMVHVPYYTVQHLRRQGMRADYLAIGSSPYWNQCDYSYIPGRWPLQRPLREFSTFWRIVARYEVVHAHFMYTLSADGWELPVLKRLGRRLVVHFRGCEARDRTRNMALHPQVNICQDCDHNPYICETPSAERRRAWARRFADATLVTTPDMRDFIPEAEHFPFFAPDIDAPPAPEAARPAGRDFTIVHATSQPGIEGTREIERAIDRLRTRGRCIRFRWLHDLTHDQVLAAFGEADLAIGKMKMGYYANAQIESMTLGVPTITFVRDEFMTDELRRSGFIFTTLDRLEATIEYYLDNPEALAQKRRIARASILRLHDNDRLARQLVGLYRNLVQRAPAAATGQEATA
jgi:glycosyltransferase involved in cell wall biosynthesis